jgi:hypothetical protein
MLTRFWRTMTSDSCKSCLSTLTHNPCAPSDIGLNSHVSGTTSTVLPVWKVVPVEWEGWTSRICSPNSSGVAVDSSVVVDLVDVSWAFTQGLSRVFGWICRADGMARLLTTLGRTTTRTSTGQRLGSQDRGQPRRPLQGEDPKARPFQIDHLQDLRRTRWKEGCRQGVWRV